MPDQAITQADLDAAIGQAIAAVCAAWQETVIAAARSPDAVPALMRGFSARLLEAAQEKLDKASGH